MEKKGLSPVVATVILISIAIILAVIIFLWARGFVSDQVLKLDRPIEDICSEIKFSAEARIAGESLEVTIVNQASFALYGIEVKKKTLTSTETLSNGAKPFESGTLSEGSDTQVLISLDASDGINAGSEVFIAPMVVGTSEDIMKSYTCDVGETVVVG